MKLHLGGKLIELQTFVGAGAPQQWGSNTTSSGTVTTDYDANTTTVTARQVRNGGAWWAVWGG
jgi:hypothetical protein